MTHDPSDPRNRDPNLSAEAETDGNAISPLPGEPGIPNVAARQRVSMSKKGLLAVALLDYANELATSNDDEPPLAQHAWRTALAVLHDDEAPRGRLYTQFAVALALGALTHYRFGPILLVGAIAFFAAGGWRRRGDLGLWLALLVGAAAWWQIIHYNLQMQGAGLHFQLVERHPWHFNAKGLLQPLLQPFWQHTLLARASCSVHACCQYEQLPFGALSHETQGLCCTCFCSNGCLPSCRLVLMQRFVVPCLMYHTSELWFLVWQANTQCRQT